MFGEMEGRNTHILDEISCSVDMLGLNIMEKKKKIDSQMGWVRPQMLSELQPVTRSDLDEGPLERLRETLSKKIKLLDSLPFEVQKAICTASRDIGSVDAISVDSRFLSKLPFPRYEARHAYDDGAFEGEFDSFALADSEQSAGRQRSCQQRDSEDDSSGAEDSSDERWNSKKARK